MPSLVNKKCSFPTCPKVVTTAYCDDHKKTARKARTNQRADRERGAKYNQPGWRQASIDYRALNPWCVMCAEAGKTTSSQVTDHIIPVELGGAFWDVNNWQALCKPCHDGPKQLLDNQLRRSMGK